MADTNMPLLQSAFKGSTELDLSFCKEVTFVETLDLSGPRLILKFDDTLSILRNVMKIKAGDVLTCTLADLMHENKLSFKAGFKIMSMPVDGELVTLNCLQKEIADMKTPAVNARLFTQEANSAESIIKGLAPGFTYDFTESFPLLSSYHLLPGERPSLILRQLANEHGAVVYACRGKLYFRRLSVLFKAPTNITFEYKNPQADYQVVDFKHINKELLLADRVVRKYVGFSITDGFLSSGKFMTAAPEVTAAESHAVLDNLSHIAVPIVDVTTWGAGHLAPGLPIQFKWNMDMKWNDSYIDESLPTQAVVGTVAHYSAGATNYFCRLTAVVPG